jgi:hypothetical protein
MPYRRRKGKDVWHWCVNCSDWPKAPVEYDEHQTRPPHGSGELCDQCLAKKKAGTCVGSARGLTGGMRG